MAKLHINAYFLVGILAFFQGGGSYADESRPLNLTLEQAVEEGLRFNLDLLAAKYSIPLAQADELTAGLWNNPAVLVDTMFQPMGFGKNWNQTNAGGPKQYDLILSYPLDLSGKHSAGVNSAKEATKIAEATFQDAVRQRVLQIRLGYIDVMTLQHQLELSKEKEESMNRLVHTIENRIGHKQLLPLLQMRAQLARDQATLDTRQRENALRSSKTSLAILLGRQPEETIFEAATGLRDFKLPDVPDGKTVVALALDNRPDMQALKLTRSKADLDHSLANAQAWDNFNLTAGISRQGPNLANPGDPNSNVQGAAYSWNAGLTIPLPVFNRNQGNALKATLSGEQAERQIEALRLSIGQEIGDILNQLKTTRSLIEEYESKQLKSARQVRDAQQKLLGTGSSALLDYFDAVGAYVGTVSSYYDTVGDCRRAMARLNASVGKDVLQ